MMKLIKTYNVDNKNLWWKQLKIIMEIIKTHDENNEKLWNNWKVMK